MAKTRGFTLIEMMMVVAIIAILSAIAYPSYQNQIRRSNRADAKVVLTDVAQRLERCYTSFGSYDSASCGTKSALVAGVASTEGYYAVTVSNYSGATYQLTANAVKAPQTADTGCTALSLNQLGERGPAGCW